MNINIRDEKLLTFTDKLFYDMGWKKDFINENLTEFPVNLSLEIMILSLADNKITKIPDNLSNTIRYLNLRNNEITEIPDNLPNNLVFLDLRYNKITKIPENLPENLEIHLNENPIEYALIKYKNNKNCKLPKNIKFFRTELEIKNHIKKN